MTRNVGRLEWKIRAGAGMILIALALFIEWPEAWEGLLGVVGLALLLTGLVRYCPINHVLGVGQHNPKKF